MKKFWIIGFTFCILVAGLIAYASATLLLNHMAASPESTAIELPFKAAAVVPEGSESIVPHKALYKIEMVQRNSSSQVLNISGEMYFEWKPACGAWTTNHRFNLLYEYTDSPQMRIASNFTTYELMNGTAFDFNSRRRRDGDVYEELRGHASLPQKNIAGEAVFTLPEGLQYELPPGTYFPMAHTLAVLKATKSGQKFFRATIFDGSDQDGPVEVSTFIGKAVDGVTQVTPGKSIDQQILNSPAHMVRLAFFPLGNPDPDSDYEMDMVLHDNGVISDMKVDYKEFSVTQKLIGLERLSADDCTTAKAAVKPLKP